LELKWIALSPESSKETTSLQETRELPLVLKDSTRRVVKSHQKVMESTKVPRRSIGVLCQRGIDEALEGDEKKWSSKDDEDHESKAK
jgi:hypothetical protein